MKTKIAILADLHFEPNPLAGTPEGRLTDIADILLLRAVKRLNLLSKPNFCAVLGDLHNAGSAPGAEDDYSVLRKTLDLLNCPWAALSGNHDSPSAFQKSFPSHASHFDSAGVRFALFDDPEEPGYNAVRTREELERMDHLRDDGWDGPIVALQHVPLFPPGFPSDCPYRYLNAGEIVAAMKRNRISLSISGHYHKGMELIDDEGTFFLTAPALCERPFGYLEVEIEDGSVSVVRRNLAMPSELKLEDLHVHTHLAYCAENMDIAKSVRLAEAFGLAGLCFTEHSGHLYFDAKSYGSKDCLRPSAAARPEDDRTELYFKALDEAGIPFRQRGLEIDCRFDGAPLVERKDLKRVFLKTGAVHALSRAKDGLEAAKGEFMALSSTIIRSGVHVLAHPFRVFRRSGLETPKELFAPLAALLKEAGVAAEINFHTNSPSPEFVRLCADSGVKLALGSDAHNLYEIGEFAPHLGVLKEAGCLGRLDEILFKLPQIQRAPQ